MATAYFFMTGQGRKIVDKLQQAKPGKIYDKHHYKEGVREFWKQDNTLIFVMASGIVVRTIAPLIQSKVTDPAVLVIDQAGRYVISLLSGHLGGANAQAREAAAILNATPVITTASDVEGVIALDVFAKANGLDIGQLENMKYVSGAMVEKKPLNMISQWQFDGTLPENVKVYVSENKDLRDKGLYNKDLDKDLYDNDFGFDAGVLEDIDRRYPAAIIGTAGFCEKLSEWYQAGGSSQLVCLTAPVYVVGTGCKKAMDEAYYMQVFESFIRAQHIVAEDIKALSTIELKKDENCILGVTKKYHLPLKIFSKEDIAKVDMNNASGQVIETSEFVKKITGVGSVSEACAYLASDCGEILEGKTKYEGVTFALAQEKKVLKV